MYKVIIIDDEPWVLARLRSIVDWGAMGFELVCEAGEAADAWRQIQAIRPDVVFTDISMPGLTGLELLARARELGVGAEFVIISGYDNFSYAQKAIESGVFHYFLKPLDASEFADVLSRLKKRLDSRPRPAKAPGVVPRTDSPCLNGILEYIHESYSQSLGLAELSGRFYVSQTYICDLFSKYLGTTFVKYLNAVRLDMAEKQLAGTDLSVSQIALETGFRDYSYFSKLFKKRFGLSPSDYRAARRAGR